MEDKDYLLILKSQPMKRVRKIKQEVQPVLLENKLIDDLLESIIFEEDETNVNVGKHRDDTPEKYNQDELKMGIEIEKEHTDDPKIAIEIAKDHLAEIPDYYTRLKKMEDSAKKKD